jgi:hypothetical protein
MDDSIGIFLLISPISITINWENTKKAHQLAKWMTI